VAHDFNNILQVVVGNLDMLKRAPEERRPLLIGNALLAAEQARRITGQLLAFGRRQALRPEVAELNGLVLGMEDMLAQSLRGDIRLRLRPAYAPAPVELDVAQLQTALINLAANARDAMPQGGTIRISTEVVSKGPASPRELVLRVSDSGRGIDELTQRRIFEPFFTTKASGKGTGLGLSIAHAIARDHGGELVLAPSARGARFELVLPLSQERIAAPAEPAIRPASKEKLHILVVDDEPDLRSILAEMFVRMGHEAATASHGIEALQKVQRSEKAFDLVVTDFMMPELDGPGLVIALREQLSYKGKICMITGGVDFNLGPVAPLLDARLTKPFKRDQLLEMLAAVAATK